jgi:hypothetical protein
MRGLEGEGERAKDEREEAGDGDRRDAATAIGADTSMLGV